MNPPPRIPVEPAKGLTADERAVEQRAIENLQDRLPELVEAYRKKYGSEIGTDNARDIVSADYAESPQAATQWSRATQRPAAALADYLYEEALRTPDLAKNRMVVMTAGGTGAGKTTSIASAPRLTAGAQFVYDSNLGSKKSSLMKIDAARAAGNQVRVIFVHRAPEEALTGGVLPRSMHNGRIVDLEAHARMYRDAAENLGYLVRRYAKDPHVQFIAIDNSRGLGNAKVVPIESISGIRYSTTELLPKLRAALENERVQGRISEDVYRATLGASSPETPEGLVRDSRH